MFAMALGGLVAIDAAGREVWRGLTRAYDVALAPLIKPAANLEEQNMRGLVRQALPTPVDEGEEDFGCYIPGVPAFAGCTTTTGGRDASSDLIFVDRLNDENNGLTSCTGNCNGNATTSVCDTVTCFRGSAREAATASGPRFVIFTVSGYIDLTEQIIIEEDDLTLACQTAPAPGVTFRYYGIEIGASNVVTQHCRVRAGWDTDLDNCNNGMSTWNYTTNPTNILIDHADVAWAQDAGIGVGVSTFNVVIWRSLVAEGLFFPDGSAGCTGGGANAGQGFQYHGDSSSATAESISHVSFMRNPQANGDQTGIFVNNLVSQPGDDSGFYAVNFDAGGGNGGPWEWTVRGNRWKQGAAGPPGGSLMRWWSDNAGTPVPAGNEVCWDDNVFDDNGTGVWSGGTLNELGYDPVVLTCPVALPMGYTPIAASALESHLLSRAGARPGNPDSVTSRIRSEIAARTSLAGFISDEDEVGGWPSLATNTAALAVPADPNGSGTCGASRSKVECWLITVSAGVE